MNFRTILAIEKDKDTPAISSYQFSKQYVSSSYYQKQEENKHKVWGNKHRHTAKFHGKREKVKQKYKTLIVIIPDFNLANLISSNLEWN